MHPTIEPWPELTLSGWEDTRDTFHMWTQIVGKVRAALEPMQNHWWNVTLYVTPRGLTTSLMHTSLADPARLAPNRAGPADLGLEMELDLVDHVLDLRTSNGTNAKVALEPRTVASFYEATMAALADLGAPVTIATNPQEVVEAIPFPLDEVHRSYDPDAIARFHRALLDAHRVMSEFRTGFVGKCSPVHFFWGAPDLALTRFSGRTAPTHPGGVANCPDWVQVEAYSHEVSSCGFWPGGSEEGSFYAYAYPQPPGFADWPVAPAAAYWDTQLGEFILPYAAVRRATDPDAYLLEFLQSTYDAAADLADWDRDALEVPPGRRPPP